MKQIFVVALMLGVAALPSTASAQQSSITQTIAGTRLDINATGEVTRVPDVAVISAGVVSRSGTAAAALQDAADRMAKVLAALKKAGVEDRDVQSSNVSLNPEYRYQQDQAPQLVAQSRPAVRDGPERARPRWPPGTCFMADTNFKATGR